MRKMCLLSFAILLLAVPSHGIIVHHCTYTPSTVDDRVHDHHDGGSGGCSNITADTEESYPGTCDFTSGFYWTEMECSSTSCQITGTLYCGGSTKSYSLSCPGSSAGASASANRDYAVCENGDGSVTHYCDCSTSCN